MAGVVSLYHNFGLVWAWVARDLRARYRGSTIGLFWSVCHPLILLLLYTFVFSTILRVRIGPEVGTGSFPLFLFAGMLPWIAFAESLSRSASVILENASLIKRTLFPSEVLPVSLVISAMISQLIGLGVLLLALLLTSHKIGGSLLVLPAILVLQFLLTAGLAWILAATNVFFRDVGHLLGMALTLWMFLTPIVYPPSMVPEKFRILVILNPLAPLVGAFRASLLGGQFPDGGSLAVLVGFALAAFFAGSWMFGAVKRSFADVI